MASKQFSARTEEAPTNIAAVTDTHRIAVNRRRLKQTLMHTSFSLPSHCNTVFTRRDRPPDRPEKGPVSVGVPVKTSEVACSQRKLRIVQRTLGQELSLTSGKRGMVHENFYL